MELTMQKYMTKVEKGSSILLNYLNKRLN